MSDLAEPRAETPYATTPAGAHVDALAGDWSEGLRGPAKASGLSPPRLLGAGPAATAATARPDLPQPGERADEQRTEQADLHALLAMKDKLLAEAPKEPEVNAPEGWASAEEDQLASSPPPPRTEPLLLAPAQAAPSEVAAAPEALPAAALEPAATEAAAPEAASAPAAADLADVEAAVLSLAGLDKAVAVPSPPAGSPDLDEVVAAEPLPEDAIVELTPEVAWEAPDAALDGWGAPVAPAAAPAWGEAPWGSPVAEPAVPVTDAWGAAPAAGVVPVADVWAAAAPVHEWSATAAAPAPPIPESADPWEAPEAAARSSGDGWSIPEAAPAAAAPAGDDSPFAPLAPGATLSEPEPAGSREAEAGAPSLPSVDVSLQITPVEPHAAHDQAAIAPEDADLLVPVLEPEEPLPTGPLAVLGEHRVAITTRAGRTRRGILRDVDLAAPQYKLHPVTGGGWETVKSDEVKVIFFMLPPGEKAQLPTSPKVKVTFAADGRAIEGHRDGEEAPSGFFLVPVDAAKTNTRRIFVAREALSEVVG